MVITDNEGKKKFKHYLVGPAHRMVSSHLTKNQQGFFQMDWEIAVPARKAEAAFKAITKHIEENATCLPLVGVFVRFAPAEDQTLIAHTAATGGDWQNGEPAVFFEMPVYVPTGFDQDTFKQYEKQFIEFATMLITDYSGRPHWGKNRQWTFDMIVDKKAYGKNLELFQQAINQLDPHGTFANDFGKSLGLQWKEE
jgi:FAD/FMN-containing dehydrogenase